MGGFDRQRVAALLFLIANRLAFAALEYHATAAAFGGCRNPAAAAVLRLKLPQAVDSAAVGCWQARRTSGSRAGVCQPASCWAASSLRRIVLRGMPTTNSWPAGVAWHKCSLFGRDAGGAWWQRRQEVRRRRRRVGRLLKQGAASDRVKTRNQGTLPKRRPQSGCGAYISRGRTD